MIRLLVTGGSGYLGRHLVPMASTRFHTAYTYFSHDPLQGQASFALDIRDETAVQNLLEQLRPDIIIHTAGSNRQGDMAGIITTGTAHVAEAAGLIGARLIHISTDVIFDGRNAPYNEDAPPSPIHAYGRAKAQAEQHAARHPDHVIIRTSLIYGLETMDHGTEWMVKMLQDKKPVTLFTDQRRNSVWVESLCSACLELAESDYQGILNVAGNQPLTRAEFGLRMLDWWGIEDRSTLAFGPSDADRWPADCTLDIGRAQAILSTSLPGVDAVLNQHGHNRDLLSISGLTF